MKKDKDEISKAAKEERHRSLTKNSQLERQWTSPQQQKSEVSEYSLANVYRKKLSS